MLDCFGDEYEAGAFRFMWRVKMATYGIETVPGQVQWTGFSNTLGSGAANQPATAGYVMFNGTQQGDDRLAKMFRNGAMTSAVTQLMYTLLGAAVGGTATKTKTQVQWQLSSPGGLIPIETVTLVNRATTANDLNAFQNLLRRVPAPAVYAPDISGNGGGGKGTW
jgi:hypothetical protein